jgi:hypothetical protein
VETPEPGLTLSRRSFIALSAGTVAVLAAAYAGLRQVGVYPTVAPTLGLRVLTDKEVAIFRRLGDYLVPPGGPLPGSGGDDESIRRMDALFAGLPPHKLQLSRALPLVFEHGTTLDRFGARCMSKLPEHRCEQYLSSWSSSEFVPQMQLWVAAKTFFGLSYFERPDVLAGMGFAVLCGRPS